MLDGVGSMSRLVAAVFALIFAAGAATAETTESRVALVIGNSAYQYARRLANPDNDARSMTETLRGLGFEVVSVVDADRTRMVKALAEFRNKLGADGVGLFYYAGHGMQVRGHNYLIPVDADISEEGDASLLALDLESIQRTMEDRGVRLSLYVLDACRNDPFERRFRSAGSRGLAPIDAARGSVIAFATAPGTTAADGAGEHGLYTGELLQRMVKPGLELDEVLKQTAEAVERASGNQQTPWYNSAFHGHFYFAPVTINVTSPPAATTGIEKDVLFWETIKASSDPADFEDFLNQFPQSSFAALAQRRMAMLRLPPTPTSPQAVTPPPAAAIPPPKTGSEIARELQSELQRVGCYAGPIDGVWGTGAATAVQRFNQQTGKRLDTQTASIGSITAVHERAERVCPAPSVRPQTRRQPAGRDRRDEPTPHAVQAAPTPVAAPPQHRDCFTFNGQQVCN